MITKKIISVLAVLFIVTIAAFIHSVHKCNQLQADLDRQTENVGTLNYDVEYGKLGDSLPVAQTHALQAKYDELQKLHLADTKLIKDLKVRLKDVQSVHTASSITAGTVHLTPEPSAAPAITSDSASGTSSSSVSVTPSNPVYTYSDKWLSLRIDISKRECQYSSRDSLTTIVSRIYKHRFLWWRWGTKGYDVRIVNFNPHSQVKYSRYIEIVK